MAVSNMVCENGCVRYGLSSMQGWRTTMEDAVFNCYNKCFCLHFEAFHLGISPVYIAFLCFMGDVAEARSFSYRLEVGSNGRKLIWEGTPRSIRDSHQKVRNSHDVLIIQRNMALFFSGGAQASDLWPDLEVQQQLDGGEIFQCDRHTRWYTTCPYRNGGLCVLKG